MRHLDLFSGIGGFAYAAQQVWGKEYENIGHSDIEKFACERYHQHFPESKCLGSILNIRKIDCDMITGGFPCQDVSVANSKGKGLQGERTGLFWRMAEIIELSKPKWILLENVPGLLSKHNGRDLLQVIRRLSEIGYCVCWRVLDAQYFGVAQRRKRVWFVGSFGNTSSVKVLFEPKSSSRNDKKKFEIRERGLCISTRCEERQDPTAETFIASTIRSNMHDTAGRSKPETLIASTIGSTTRGKSSFVWQDTHIAEINPSGKRTVDGLSRKLDNPRGKVLGNAIVPQVAIVIMQAIKEIEQGQQGLF